MPDTFRGDLPDEHAHLTGQKKPLLSRHRALNPQLRSLRFWSGIGYGHGRMLARGPTLLEEASSLTGMTHTH